MSLLTVQARSSVFTVPGIMMNPLPSGVVTHADWPQISDQYAGLLIKFPGWLPNKTTWVDEDETTHTWVDSKKNTSVWVDSRNNGSVWVGAKNKSSAWVKENQKSESWSDEVEVDN